jgi:hypothetical protein
MWDPPRTKGSSGDPGWVWLSNHKFHERMLLKEKHRTPQRQSGVSPLVTKAFRVNSPHSFYCVDQPHLLSPIRHNSGGHSQLDTLNVTL